MTRPRFAVLIVALIAPLLSSGCADGSDEPATGPGTTVLDTVGGDKCSARELSKRPTGQAALPDPVAASRARIVDAAVACDYDALARLARGGAVPFSYSFGDSGHPARFWRSEEEAGREPLRFLVKLLDRPHATRAVGNATHYVWPSAFGYETWAEVPEPDRAALAPLYDDDDFDSFDKAGSYVGYRVGIDDQGEWLFFVAGD